MTTQLVLETARVSVRPVREALADPVAPSSIRTQEIFFAALSVWNTLRSAWEHTTGRLKLGIPGPDLRESLTGYISLLQENQQILSQVAELVRQASNFPDKAEALAKLSEANAGTTQMLEAALDLKRWADRPPPPVDLTKLNASAEPGLPEGYEDLDDVLAQMEAEEV